MFIAVGACLRASRPWAADRYAAAEARGALQEQDGLEAELGAPAEVPDGAAAPDGSSAAERGVAAPAVAQAGNWAAEQDGRAAVAPGAPVAERGGSQAAGVPAADSAGPAEEQGDNQAAVPGVQAAALAAPAAAQGGSQAAGSVVPAEVLDGTRAAGRAVPVAVPGARVGAQDDSRVVDLGVRVAGLAVPADQGGTLAADSAGPAAACGARCYPAVQDGSARPDVRRSGADRSPDRDALRAVLASAGWVRAALRDCQTPVLPDAHRADPARGARSVRRRAVRAGLRSAERAAAD